MKSISIAELAVATPAPKNRLVRRADNGKTVLIVYDGDGNRVKKTVTTSTNTVTTWFLVDMVNPTGYAQVSCSNPACGSGRTSQRRQRRCP